MDADAATAELILALQLADIAEFRRYHPNENDDCAVAMSLYHDELRDDAALVCDRRFGEDIGQAQDPDVPHDDPLPSTTPNVDQIPAEALAGMTVSDDSSSDHQTAGPGHCVSCETETRDPMTAPCGHQYCEECLATLFELAMTDESMFPPRCCRQEITLDRARSSLTSAKIDEFQSKSVELSTLDRTYCHDATCATFIPPENIDGEKATCMKCNLVTCSVCKSSAHEGDCPQDPAFEMFMTTAREAGFQACFNCKRMVELNIGCNHITYVLRAFKYLVLLTDFCSCLCRTEFCYLCGQRWKTCLCAQWDETRLIERAVEIADRRPAGDRAARAVQVGRARQRLIDRHDCAHASWNRVSHGNLRCEECHSLLPAFLLECRRCELRVCRRCSCNRL